MTEKTINTKITELEAALDAANHEHANLQALNTLIKNNRVHLAPTRIELVAPDYKIVSVGIGKDHTATILITTTDLQAMRHILGQETTNES